MFKLVDSPWLVPFDGSFRVAKAQTKRPDDSPSKSERVDALAKLRARLAELQQVLYASDRYSVLLVFQAMDAAGKDGTIRAVLEGVNPAGCQVFSFKAPSHEELEHDFLWRTSKRLPERGRIGVFNRSAYEEVLVVRVHPEYLDGQRLPPMEDLSALFDARFQSLREHERHLVENGTLVLKFWLNVSKDEQRERFLERIEDPGKNWKFNEGDLTERGRWDDYMDAYEAALNATSREVAPWYAIPADSKSYMRMAVAEIVVKALEQLALKPPELDDAGKAKLGQYRDRLKNGG